MSVQWMIDPEKRLMIAVTCFAVAFAAWSLGANGSADQFLSLWIILVVTMPGAAMGCLFGKWWVGVAVSVAILLFLNIAGP